MKILQWQKWWSYLWPVTLTRRQSELSGYLEVRLENGKVVLNGRYSNYSEGEVAELWYFALRYFKPPQNVKNSILMLGYGAGSLVHILQQRGYNQAIDAVEYDTEVVKMAREYFAEAQGQAKIVEADAQTYIENTTQRYGLIFIDLFIDNVVPGAFLQESFIKDVKNKMATGGRVYQNVMLQKGAEKELLSIYERYFAAVRTYYKYENNLVIEAR